MSNLIKKFEYTRILLLLNGIKIYIYIYTYYYFCIFHIFSTKAKYIQEDCQIISGKLEEEIGNKEKRFLEST